MNGLEIMALAMGCFIYLLFGLTVSTASFVAWNYQKMVLRPKNLLQRSWIYYLTQKPSMLFWSMFPNSAKKGHVDLNFEKPLLCKGPKDKNVKISSVDPAKEKLYAFLLTLFWPFKIIWNIFSLIMIFAIGPTMDFLNDKINTLLDGTKNKPDALPEREIVRLKRRKEELDEIITLSTKELKGVKSRMFEIELEEAQKKGMLVYRLPDS